MNGETGLGSPAVLPGQPLQPIVLQSPGVSLAVFNAITDQAERAKITKGSQDLLLMGVTLGLSQDAHDRLVLGQGSLGFSDLHADSVVSPISIKVVLDPSKYVVEVGDTLDTIAKAKGFSSWVPLQMINRLTSPYHL